MGEEENRCEDKEGWKEEAESEEEGKSAWVRREGRSGEAERTVRKKRRKRESVGRPHSTSVETTTLVPQCNLGPLRLHRRVKRRNFACLNVKSKCFWGDLFKILKMPQRDKRFFAQRRKEKVSGLQKPHCLGTPFLFPSLFFLLLYLLFHPSLEAKSFSLFIRGLIC